VLAVAQPLTFKHLHHLAHGLNPLALPLCVYAFGVVVVEAALVGLIVPHKIKLAVVEAAVAQGLVLYFQPLVCHLLLL
jgi:hypothetical protein